MGDDDGEAARGAAAILHVCEENCGGDQNEEYVESDHVHIGDDDEGWMVHGAAAILYEREGNSKTDVHSGDDDVRWMAHWAAAILHGREGNSEIFQSERE
uniref:Uncharacterized protein n=1 Tax=Alexandrium monilatum TaxID=311494 RepID=A0A7S4RP69_9DINO